MRCFLGVLGYRERLTVAVAVVASVLAGILTAAHASAVLTFAVSAQRPHHQLGVDRGLR